MSSSFPKADCLYSIGEFAKLCNTTIDTLLHYDEIHLLLPSYVKENGRRYYNSHSYLLFYVLNLLKQSGCSLDEIKKYFQNTSQNSQLQILYERQATLQQELMKIQRTQQALQGIIDSTRKSMELPLDEIVLLRQPEERLILEEGSFENQEILRNGQLDVHLFRERFARYEEFCRPIERLGQFIVGQFHSKEDLLNGNLERVRMFRTLMPPYDETQKFHMKAAGTYVSILQTGRWPEVTSRMFAKLFSWIEENRWEIVGNAYFTPLSTFCPESETELAGYFQLMLQVKKQG